MWPDNLIEVYSQSFSMITYYYLRTWQAKRACHTIVLHVVLVQVQSAKNNVLFLAYTCYSISFNLGRSNILIEHKFNTIVEKLC